MATTATIEHPKIEVRSLIPPFELLSAEGQAVNLWRFKQQSNLVLIFLPIPDCPGCTEFLDVTKRNYHQYHDERTVALVIVRGDADAAVSLRDRLDLPFQILYDPDGHVTQQYAYETPAVFVADRFGELRAEWTAGDGRFPSQKDILDTVELINLECPE